MKHNRVKNNLLNYLVIYGICLVFICINVTPAIGTFSQNYRTTPLNKNISMISNEGDVPTWYLGDAWTYTVDPLSFSSPNGSFDGSIQNFRQTVTGMTDDTYTVSITGDISGDITVSGFSGELTGSVNGESQVRVSDLAEQTTELHSVGEIVYMWIPFDYELNLYMSTSPALEVYDFPLQVGEQWPLSGLTTITGSFSIEGVFDQSFDQSQWVDESVECSAQEQITVPAGTFDCYKIGRENTLSWYATDAGNMVKTTVDQNGENMSLYLVASLQSYLLVNQPITISEEISPSVAAPGASVVISGVAVSTGSGDPIQNGAISIEIPSTGDSWSTITNSDGQYSKTIIAPTMSDDTPIGRETGSGGVIVQCNSGGQSGYRVQTLTTVQDIPPAVPTIQGPTQGKPGTSYSYTIVTTDSENDEVFYFVDWGDSTNSSWIGPYSSGDVIIQSHTWSKKGSYDIKAKAKDHHGLESDWGTFEITMPFSSHIPSLVFWERLVERFFFLFPFVRILLQR